MCIDTDLFGDVIVTIKDVDLWLDVNARLSGRAHTQREQYAKTFDIANKIKLSKLNGSFYKLMDRIKNNAEYDAQPLSLFQSVYKNDPLLVEKKPACPNWFHVCNDFKCTIYIKRITSEKAKRRWAERKKKN